MKKIGPIIVIGIFLLSGLGTGISFGIELSLNKSTDLDELDLLNLNIDSKNSGLCNNDGTEYWALLVGCNEFRYLPDSFLPGNDEVAKDFKDLLLTSDHWRDDHIKVITGKNATKRNIINGLKWLDQMDDEDDICLFTITTHGSYNVDRYLKDEDDGYDEFLYVYDSYHQLPILGLCSFFFDFLYDDQLNYYLSKLESKGICAIINSCYSGGFDDPPLKTYTKYDTVFQESTEDKISPMQWMDEFGEELKESGRIVLMACGEHQIARGNVFEYLIMDGLKGLAEPEMDLCSVEDAYYYAVPLLKKMLIREFNYRQLPKIFDDYSGDLFITKKELPPENAFFTGPEKGSKDDEISFTIKSSDPEHDRIRYYIDWGDGTQGWTDLYKSGESVYLNHAWDTIGTYNIYFKCEDEFGVSTSEINLMNYSVISIIDEEIIDQKMTMTYEGQCFNDILITEPFWYYAQSFKPTKSKITRIDLECFISLVNSHYLQPFIVSIRDDLYGNDLTQTIVMPFQIDSHYLPTFQWTTFNIPDIDVTPGETYYIVLRFNSSGAFGCWMYAGKNYNHDPEYIDDPYPDGKPYFSENRGLVWDELTAIQDFCFVTYG